MTLVNVELVDGLLLLRMQYDVRGILEIDACSLRDYPCLVGVLLVGFTSEFVNDKGISIGDCRFFRIFCLGWLHDNLSLCVLSNRCVGRRLRCNNQWLCRKFNISVSHGGKVFCLLRKRIRVFTFLLILVILKGFPLLSWNRKSGRVHIEITRGFHSRLSL